MKDIDSELDALTELGASEGPMAPSAPGGAAPHSPAALETTDLRDGDVVRGVRAQRRTWAWLLAAAVLVLGVGAAPYFRESSGATAPPPPSRRGLATFRVEAEPAGARVWVDEVDVGPAPVAVPVSGGRHKVRVAVQGYAPAELSLDVTAGTAPPPLRFALEPITVRLSVTSDPRGATVRVDGKSIGTSPIESAIIPPGRHEVRVEKRGYAPSVQSVDGTAGEAVQVKARLTRFSEARNEPLPAASRNLIPAEGDLVAFDGSVSPPRKVSGSAPPYPDDARRVNLIGTVKVEMIVDERGHPTQLRVANSAGEILDRAVVNAVQTWRYEPATKRGVKVKLHWSYRHSYVRQ